MKDLEFRIVDVFSQGKYTGNQLGVVMDYGQLSGDEMQEIAQEINYSETTFITSKNTTDGGYDTRIFTPEEEVDFAGHPTLGTAYVIQQELAKGRPEEVVLNLDVGQIPVEIEYGNDDKVKNLTMKQRQPEFGDEFEASDIANVLGINASDIDASYPIQAVSTGLPFIMVPVVSLDVLQEIDVNLERYYDLIDGIEEKALHVFCPEPHDDGDLSARMFGDYYGVPEDPATGSANGCLAAYLAEHEYFGSGKIEVEVEQGYEIGRPSLLELRAEKTNDGIEVFVGGEVVEVAEGKLV